MANLKDLPKHLVEALSKGESVLYNGEHILPDILPNRADAVSDNLNTQGLLSEKDAEIARLSEQVKRLQEGDGKPAPTKKDDK